MARRKTLVIEFVHQGEHWHVERASEFIKQMDGLKTAYLPSIIRHVESRPDCQEAWRIVRMAYGINPLLSKTTDDPEMHKVWKTEDIATRLNKPVDEIVANIDYFAAVAGTYQKDYPLPDDPLADDPAPAPPPPPPPPSPTPPHTLAEPEPTPVRSKDDVLSLEDVAFLESYGFTTDIFFVPGRSPKTQAVEMRWFYERLGELSKLFDEPMVKSLARQALLNEMQIRRADDEMSRTAITSDRFWGLQDKKLKMEAMYSQQWEQIERLCPHFKVAKTKAMVVGVFSEIIDAYRRFKADGSTDLVDGLFTALEVQVELRHSNLAAVRYRPGLVAAINEAKANLWNPQFRRRMPQEILKCMDSGFREGFEKMREKLGLPVVDLEKDGPGGEYPALVLDESKLEEAGAAADAAKPVEREVVIPEAMVDIADPVEPDLKKRKR